MKNVIDISKRLSTKKRTRTVKGPAAPVIDMTEARNEIIDQERRKVKRTILSEFIGACAVVPTKGLVKVTIYDISENGMAFDLADEAGHFRHGEEVAMRVYLSHESYFPFVVLIQNIRQLGEERVYRHGANFVKGTINDEALYHLIRFIETVSASLRSDAGDIIVSNLTR
jgi:hypothetical protein